MNRTPTYATLALVLAAALAGCLADPAPDSSTPTTASAPGGAGGNANGAAGAADNATAGPWKLHLHADGTVAEAAPTDAGWVAYPEPVNSPMATQFAIWSGAVERGGNASATIPIQLFVTSSSANGAARLLPPFILEDLPGLFVSLQLGEGSWFVALEGPDVVHAGQVFEVTGVLEYGGEGSPPTLKPGDPVQLEIQAAYVHASQAAELRFVMGPDQPSGFVLSG